MRELYSSRESGSTISGQVPTMRENRYRGPFDHQTRGTRVRTVQSIERAFGLLEELAGEPAGISELARRIGLPTSTVARLLGTLEGVGAIERVTDGTGYRIGPTLVTLSSSVDPSQSLLAVAQPFMVELVDLVAEAVGISIPAGYDVHYVEQVDCAHPVQVRDWTGTSLPMHIVSAGLVVLAQWPDEAVDRYLGRRLERYTPDTVISPDAVRKRLEQVLTDGYIWTEEEFAEGINSVAAPLFGSGGVVVGSVHVHGPSYRFPDATMRDVIAGQVVASAAAISSALGHGHEA